jgi:hypothetical protein
VKVEGRADGALGVQYASNIDAFATVEKKAFNTLRQVAMRVVMAPGKVENVEALAKPTRVFAVAGDQDRDVDWSAFSHTEHSGSTGAHTLDGFCSRVNLFDIDSWR